MLNLTTSRSVGDAMDRLYKMRFIPLDFPALVMTEAERTATSTKQCIGYLQAVENDIVLRVFAYRRLKGKQMQITEIMRRITQDNRYIWKNLYGGYYQGYQVVYEKKDVIKYEYGCKCEIFSEEYFDHWYEETGNVFGIWYRIINADMLNDTQFKYCGYKPTVTDDVIGYLNEYIKHPCVEYFGKLGIKPTATLIRKAEKDKAFRNWLYKTKIDGFCGPQAIIYAYEHKTTLEKAEKILKNKSYLDRAVASMIPEIKGTKLNRERVLDYAQKKDVGTSNYNDYLKALKKLKYDLTDTKNLFPYDFKTMHDLRVAEYDSVMAKEDEEKRAELYSAFSERAKAVKNLEYSGESYSAIIPFRVPDLVSEGKALHHCVGKMGYDKKMADGEIVIVFIRSLLDLAKPLVTVEYSFKRKRIVQAHGEHNRRPTDEEQAFIDEWEKRTNEIMKAKKGA
jgi:hypothetical protein